MSKEALNSEVKSITRKVFFLTHGLTKTLHTKRYTNKIARERF